MNIKIKKILKYSLVGVGCLVSALLMPTVYILFLKVIEYLGGGVFYLAGKLWWLAIVFWNFCIDISTACFDVVAGYLCEADKVEEFAAWIPWFVLFWLVIFVLVARDAINDRDGRKSD